MCGLPLGQRRCSGRAGRQRAGGTSAWTPESYLMIQLGAGERVGGRRRDGRGGHMVDGLQRRGSFNARLSTGHGGHAKRRGRNSKPGLGERTRDGVSAHATQLLPGAQEGCSQPTPQWVCLQPHNRPLSLCDCSLTTGPSVSEYNLTTGPSISV